MFSLKFHKNPKNNIIKKKTVIILVIKDVICYNLIHKGNRSIFGYVWFTTDFSSINLARIVKACLIRII